VLLHVIEPAGPVDRTVDTPANLQSGGRSFHDVRHVTVVFVDDIDDAMRAERAGIAGLAARGRAEDCPIEAH
jgi:pyrimidine operon attenuation protein/uracil phosphoribosyltransferase